MGPAPSTNGPQEKFVSLQHAAACFSLLVRDTFFSVRRKGDKKQTKHSEKQTLTPCKYQHSRINS